MDGEEAAPDSASDQADPDIVEVDDDTIEAMNAPQEGELMDDEDGEPVEPPPDDSICTFPDHTDAVFDVDVLPVEPHDIFVSGDCAD